MFSIACHSVPRLAGRLSAEKRCHQLVLGSNPRALLLQVCHVQGLFLNLNAIVLTRGFLVRAESSSASATQQQCTLVLATRELATSTALAESLNMMHLSFMPLFARSCSKNWVHRALRGSISSDLNILDYSGCLVVHIRPNHDSRGHSTTPLNQAIFPTALTMHASSYASSGHKSRK